MPNESITSLLRLSYLKEIDVIKYIKNAEHLEIYERRLEDISKQFATNVDSVVKLIQTIQDIPFSELNYYSLQLFLISSLKNLEFDQSFYNITKNCKVVIFGKIMQCCPNLEYLSLIGFTHSKVFINALPKLPNIVVLNLERSDIDDSMLQSILQTCEKLRDLNVNSCPNLTIRALEYLEISKIMPVCKLLDTLDFWHHNVTSYQILVILKCFPVLGLLKVPYLSLLKAIKLLIGEGKANEMPPLYYLECWFIDPVFEKEINLLTLVCPKIREIKVRNIFNSFLFYQPIPFYSLQTFKLEVLILRFHPLSVIFDCSEFMMLLKVSGANLHKLKIEMNALELNLYEIGLYCPNLYLLFLSIDNLIFKEQPNKPLPHNQFMQLKCATIQLTRNDNYNDNQQIMDAIYFLLRYATGIIELYLSEINIPDNIWKKIFQVNKMNRLLLLSLSDISGITLESIKTLLSFKNIEIWQIEIYNCENIHEDDIRVLENFIRENHIETRVEYLVD